MKDSKKILIFFIVVFMLFWNPITFYLFFSNEDIYDSSFVRIFYWIVPIASIGVIFVLRRNQNIFSKVQNVIFGFAFFGIFLGLLILSNLILGFFSQPNYDSIEKYSKLNGLVFEPNTVARYTSVEFDFKAEINSIGLRNKEISIVKEKGTYRILCFGDSWTFGWGVNIENSYPKQLENYLHNKGYSKVEVVNCGRPGKYTSFYKDYMSEAVPLLKPDLVLVGVNQLDDLAQLYERKFYVDGVEKGQLFLITETKNLLKSFFKASFGNYINLFKKNNIKNDEIVIKKIWKSNANKQIRSFDKLQNLRYFMLTDTLRKMFSTGNLNPYLLNFYMNRPNRITVFNNPTNPASIFALSEMDNDIKEMKIICSDNNVKMIFINMPTNVFTGHKVESGPAEVLNPYFLNNNKIDSMYRNIAVNNKIQYLEQTKSFIELKNKQKYYFLFDGHPNKEGYKQIAMNIGTYLIDNNLKTK